MKIIGKILKILALLWAVFFAVFYFDLDGKLLYYIWEPFAEKRFDHMEREDNTGIPYELKDEV